MNEKLVYLSFLATDDFLPGLLVLAHSLVKTRPKAPFVVLVTDNVSAEVLADLRKRGLSFRVIEPIPFPAEMEVTESRWRNNYSKLRIFEQTQFDKIVYLDADMVVCGNIDVLFDRPHMSAVSAGSLLRRNAEWRNFNSGLMVIEPDAALFRRMRDRIGKIDGKGHGDQGFLHGFFPEWPDQPELHLHHSYNQLDVFLDDHRWLKGYRLMKGTTPASEESRNEKLIKVIHYIGPNKPWFDREATRRWVRRHRWIRSYQSRALELWLALDEEVEGSGSI